MVALCHWGGFRGEGKCPGETCTWSWQSQGHEINVSPPLAQTRWLQPVQALSLTSCARESCPSLNFGETGRPKPKSCPLLFGKVKPDFHPAWLCPTVLNFTGYANTHFLLPGAGQHFMPCAVTPLSCDPSVLSTFHLCTLLELGTGLWIQRSLNKSRNPGYSPGQAPPVVQGQVLSLCKASPSVSEKSSRSVDLHKTVDLTYTTSWYFRAIACLM